MRERETYMSMTMNEIERKRRSGAQKKKKLRNQKSEEVYEKK